MKAGAAFVLLDPSYPVNRLQAICEDVGARLIITSPAQSDLASLLSETVVRVSDSQEYWSHTTASNWSNPASQPTNALYVVFTSGSTGKPKGVLIEHAAFATRATAAGPGLGLDQKPRVLQFSSYAFHVSYRDILTTLCWGGCLCVPCEEDRRNDLSSFITRREISWACLTPSVITLLDPTKLPSLEVLVVAGESMPPATLDSWAGRVQLMNAYGPCECVGINALQSNLTVGMDCQNIGHGLAAVLWLVDVDNHDKLAPIGAVGEIVIEGPVMGRGYINHPEKTKESFLPSAAWQTRFRETGNSRLYMTGDLGRYDATDGTIVFVGRKDTQTKLNGQLIEMRDVEHHLQKSLAVSEAQVVPDLAVDVITPKGSTVPRLVACIETQGEKRNANNCLNTPEAVPESWHNLESQLATNLPKFMIPSSFIPVHQMPMTLSGKKDRKALKAVLESLSLGELQAYSSSSLVYEAPLNDQEKKLQSLWATALKQDSSSIGRQSHLFQLGGDSITAMKLVSLSREVGMKLTVDDIFQHPVLSAQAQACSSVTETNGDASVSAPYVPFSLINQNSSQQILASCARQCNLKPDQIEDVYPCTALQEGLMALTLRTQTAYTAQHVYRLHQSLDEEKYQAAWMATMEANPILRTRIVQTREGSFQVVAKSPPLIWNRRSNLDQCLEEDKREPMQLGGALIRLGIASDDSGQRYCVVTIYHALYDGWSKPLIPSQVQRAYHGDHLDRRPFAPFIKHVIHARHGSESFWATRLAGCEAPSFPSLPSADYIPSPKSSTEELQISCGTNPIETFTLNSRLRLAWALTLSHYLGSDDVVFGATVSGRGASVPGMDQMSGPAITTIPVRVQLSSNRTVKDTLQEIQTDFFRAIPNEQLGLARISKLNDAAHSACQFQNLLVVQPKQERQAKGNDFMRPVEYAESKDLAAFGTYAMTVHCQVQDKSNSVTLQLFSDEGIVGLPQAQRTINHFAHVLSLVNSNLDAPLVALASVSPQDMAELMAWNNPLPKSVNRCVQDLIAEQVSSQPEAEAVCAWDGSFSYQRLQQHSTTLARSLISAGVYRGDIIPIHMTKSQWLPVAILGVVMTGASFTLLDPSYPPQRIKTILNEIVVKVILSNVPEHEHLPWGTNARVLSMPDIFLGLCSKDQRPLNVVSDPRDCLYVAWTSGSTGKPKGVMINHNSLASTVGAWEETFNLTSTSRVLQFSANAFDASIFEGFATLMVGGCVCMPSEASRQSDIATVIQDMQVNWAELTPTVARLLRPADIQGVRMLTLLGEPVTQEDISIWRDHTNLFIGYGPTECTICSTSHSNPRPTDDSSIGSGVGSVCWVVNPADHNILLPIGAVGELLIEGPNVGMGYLNDLEKTKASFPDIPQWLRQFRNGEKTRLYKTGDLVQYSSNNKLRFIGRKDNQVKLHGQRLELGDIERHVWQALRDGGSKFDNMGEAVVAELVHPIARNGRPTLVAFISVNAHSHALKTCDEAPGSLLLPSTRFTETCNNVQAVMLARVPKHMVPAVFFPLVALPQTLTGKVDRKGLRELCVSLSASTWDVYTRRHNKDSRPPSNNAEQMLYNLVKDVLDIEDFGMDSHFFHLGGDSLVAMQVVSLAHEAGIQLYVHDFFKFPILAALAKTLKAHQEDMQEIRPFQLLANANLQEEALELAQRTFQVSRDDIEDIYPCTPLQEGMFAETLKKRSRAQNPYVSKSVFKFREDIDLKGFRIAWEKVAKINPILRTRILSGLSKTLQVVMANPSLPWEEHEGTLEDFRRGMSNHDPIPDFQKPLLQFSVVRDVQNHQKYFVSTIHHALYDGWSWPLIIDQLEAAYNSTTPTISPRPYVSFVKYIQSLDEHKVVNFWKSQLDGISAPQFPVLPSPTFKPNPNKSLTRRSLRIHDPSVMGVTSASVIQLSWALTVTQYTDSNDCVFGLVASGRDAPFNGIERVVGPTMATFPLCTRLEKSKMVQELLSDMQTQGILAASYGHMGLQNISRLGADAAAGCQFQNLLVIQPSSTDDSNPFFGQKVKFPADATPAFDAHALTVVCNLKDSGQLVDVQASYDETVISTCQMGWVLDQFGHFIEWVSQEPQGRVDDIAAVSPNHLQQLRIWNQSPAHPVRSCIHDLVFQRQGLDPTALAVNSWDGDLTYRELDVLSSCLAKRLTEDNGIGPGTFVPLFFEKSKWVVVAMLAVSKAGGAFLLLDSSQPVQRQHSLCQEVDAEVVLDSLGHVDRISNPGWHVLPIGDGSINGEDGANDDSTSFSHPAVCSDDPVYICFTSGSTGKPKGAVIEHAMIATTAVIQGKIQGLNPQTRVLQFTSFTFDTCLAEILYTLVHGGCICLPEEAGGRAVVPAIHKYNVNWVALTPSVARTVDPEDIPSVKTLVLGGEAMQANDVATWGDRLFLANGYGPTECAVETHINAPVGIGSKSSNIGRGVTAVSWVVDPDNVERLMPLGAPGELLIEGPTVGRGYLNEPEKTDAAFIKSPSWLQDMRMGQGRRIYRTGDLVRFSPESDASLEILGRKDSQVKIRGQRIELGEVEFQVRRLFPGAKAVVAETIQPAHAGPQLLLTAFIHTGYADGEASTQGTDNEIFLPPQIGDFAAQVVKAEALLQEHLPKAMIPELFVPLAYLPLSSADKTDRLLLRKKASALSVEEIRAYKLEDGQVKRQPPAAPTEAMLHELVAHTLGLDTEAFGMNDHFLRLGGDSILAMRLVSSAYKRGMVLKVADIFAHPRLSDLANIMISVNEQAQEIPPFVLIQPDEREFIVKQAVIACAVPSSQIEDIYPYTPLQEGLLALTMQHAGAYTSRLSLSLSKNISRPIFQIAWAAVLDANPILRTRIIHVPQYGSFQVVVKSGMEWRTVTDLDTLTVEMGNPLMQFGFTSDDQFVFTLHHALYDGLSLQHIFRQLQAACVGQRLSRQPFVPFVKYLSGIDPKQASEFWRTQLADLKAPMFPEPPSGSHTAKPIKSLTSRTTFKMRDDFGVTLSALMKLAWGLTISRYTSANDVLYGAVVSGRSASIPGVEGMSGPTIATIPVRIRFSLEQTGRQMIEEVHQQGIQSIPFEQTGLQSIKKLGNGYSGAMQFQNLLVIQDSREGKASGDSLFTVNQNTDADKPFGTYGLILLCYPESQHIDLEAIFDDTMISSWQVDRILHYFQHILVQLNTACDLPLYDMMKGISLEDTVQLKKWNRSVPPSVQGFVHDLIIEKATVNPDATAICAWDGMLTYGELDRLSLQLSHVLVLKGAGPEGGWS